MKGDGVPRSANQAERFAGLRPVKSSLGGIPEIKALEVGQVSKVTPIVNLIVSFLNAGGTAVNCKPEHLASILNREKRH